MIATHIKPIRIISTIITLALLYCPTSHANEIANRSFIISQTINSFLNNDFEKLNQQAEEYRAKQSRTDSGVWKLTQYYKAFGQIAEDPAKFHTSPEEIDKKAKIWESKFPKSPTPHIIQAFFLIEKAWSYRGSGWSNTVKPENWTPFYNHLNKAKLHLEKHKDIAKNDPAWYENMLIIAKAENWEYQDFKSLIDEATNRHPYFYQIYFSAIDYLTPKWHGDKGKIEEFAQFAVEKTQSKEKTGMYARVYWYASEVQYGEALFTQSSVVWPKMKKSIDDVLALYPDQWNINNFTLFACLAKDKEKARTLFNTIQKSTTSSWGKEDLLARCEIWLNTRQ